MAANRQRVTTGQIRIGDYILVDTNKPVDVWWKVLSEQPYEVRSVGMTVRMRKLHLVNKDGYEKDIVLDPGTGRRYYRWLPPEQRLED